MLDNNIIPVILAGGAGTRLWPLSRERHPKQFLPMAVDRSMLQETVRRLNALANVVLPIIICSEMHRFLGAWSIAGSGIYMWAHIARAGRKRHGASSDGRCP